MIAVLGSLRGRVVRPEELASLERELAAIGQPLASLWKRELHPLLERMLGHDAAGLPPARLAAQLRTTFHYTRLLAHTAPAEACVASHLWRDGASPAQVMGLDRARTSLVIDTDHYSMLAEPAVARLAASIRAALGDSVLHSAKVSFNDTYASIR